MKQSTLRTPLAGGLTLERVFDLLGAVTITVFAPDETVLFSEEIAAPSTADSTKTEAIY